MAHRGADEITDLIADIVKSNPRISASGISNKLDALYEVKANIETVRKLTNRMIKFDGLRAGQTSRGQIVYYFAGEA